MKLKLNYYSASPVIPAEVLDLFYFLQVGQPLLETALAIPSHHPCVAPTVVKQSSTRVAWKYFRAHLTVNADNRKISNE